MHQMPTMSELATPAHPVLKAFIAMGVLLAAITQSSRAETRTVCTDGGCDFTTIQAAIDAAAPGDVIEVSAGLYSVEQTIDTLGKAVALRGSVDPGTGALQTILDGQGATRVLQCLGGEGADTVIEDLVVRNGRMGSSSDAGGGLLVEDSSPTIRNCTFKGSYSGNKGGAISFEGSQSVLTDCLFSENESEYGGSLFLSDSDLTLERCTFMDNNAEYTAGGVYSRASALDFVECDFSGNQSEFCGAAYLDASTVAFSDCNITGNQAESSGAVLSYRSDAQFTNCIFTGNRSMVYSAAITDLDSGTTTITDCRFENNVCEEYGASVFLANTGCDITITGSSFMNNAPGGLFIQEPCAGTRVGSSVFCSNSYYQVFGSFSDEGGNCFLNACTDQDDDGTPDCTNGEDPDPSVPDEYETLGEAIDAAADGAVITVAAGTHYTERTLELFEKELTIRGEVDPETGEPLSIIDAQNTHDVFISLATSDHLIRLENLVIQNGTRGMYLEECTVELINCTIRNNSNATGGGALLIWNSTSTMIDCLFDGNSAASSYSGGGIGMYGGTFEIERCEFRNNTSGWGGGGIELSSSGTFTDCTFTNNLSGGDGGGMRISGGTPVTLDRCLFTGNSASGTGGGISNGGDATTLIDTILCENSPAQLNGRYIDGGGNCITESCTDCATCPGDIDQDGDVGGADLTTLLTEWGCAGQDCTADLDDSGTVDGADLTIILSSWGSCLN